MSLRKTPLISKEFYHIYNRGNSKQTIFHDKADYSRFLKLLFIANSRLNFKLHLIKDDIYNFDREQQLVHIGAYCLMPNHFHLLLTQIEEGGISKFMQKVSTGYSMYYNKRYKRTGTLFEGKFKSTHSDNDRYLKYLFSYMHLNPVKLIDAKWREHGIKNKNRAASFLDQYNYSSYQDYLGHDRSQAKILDINLFPKYFLTKEVLKNEIYDWINHEASI